MGELSPNSDFNFFENVGFFASFCVVFVFPNVSQQKKWKGGGVGVWGLTDPSFS